MKFNDNEIEQMLKLKEDQPYLVILGAGATMATIENGDRNGKKSATMQGFLKKLNMEDILEGVKLKYKGDNLEDIYSELCEKPQYRNVVETIERTIIDYFSDFELPSELTIYDYLVISLTKKDCIATFNWDPLLMQAFNRMRVITEDLPELLFLHGNVAVGLCRDCKRYSPLKNKTCSICGKPLEMPPLLYPVNHKNYDSDIFIKDQWMVFNYYCKQAGLITFFGYSAPKTDIEARKRILDAYTSVNRKLDSIEILDLNSDNEEFQNSWDEFAEPSNYHVNFYKSFWESILAEYPRQAAKGYVNRFLRGKWNDSSIKFDHELSINELYRRLRPLINNQ